MLVDAIALVILAGMMLIPLINIVVGAIVGLGMGGIPGGVIGVMLAVVISLAEKLIGDRRGWFRVGCEPEYVASEGEGARITRPYPMRISSIERFGTDATSERLFGAGAILEPHIAFTGFDKEDSAATINRLLVSQGAFRVKIESGLLAHMPNPNAASFRATVSCDGVGDSDFQAAGVQVSVNWPLN